MSEELTFEQARQELERIVERLERGEAGLDEAIALWERGEELYGLCRGRLDARRGEPTSRHDTSVYVIESTTWPARRPICSSGYHFSPTSRDASSTGSRTR